MSGARRWTARLAAAGVLCAAGSVAAATLEVELADPAGAPAGDAVIYAEPTGVPVAAGGPKTAVIDQGSGASAAAAERVRTAPQGGAAQVVKLQLRPADK